MAVYESIDKNKKWVYNVQLVILTICSQIRLFQAKITRGKGDWIMRKLLRMVLFTLLNACLLTACGGGGGESNSASSSVISQAELDGAKAVLTVDANKAVLLPAMVGEYLVHLSNGSRDVFVKKTQVAKVFFNNSVVGFHSVDPTKGAELAYNPDNPILEIAGQPFSAFGATYTFLLTDDQELTLNTEARWLKLVTSDGMHVERRADGLLYGTSDTSPIPVPPKTIVEINTLTGEVAITPVIIGKQILNLIASNPSETILDANDQVIAGYRFVWNDNGSWYPASGAVAAIMLPKTAIANVTKPIGAGMPYLVRPDGTFVPFNTSPETCTFFINGTQWNVDADGLFHY